MYLFIGKESRLNKMAKHSILAEYNGHLPKGDLFFHLFQAIHNGLNLKGHCIIGCLGNKKRQGLGNGPADNDCRQAQIDKQVGAGLCRTDSKTLQQTGKRRACFSRKVRQLSEDSLRKISCCSSMVKTAIPCCSP